MNVLIDMNLSPAWRQVLQAEGWTAAHWSEVGDPRAPDTAIMEWARTNRAIVLTHDLDFGVILALTNAAGPSVIQVRAQDVLPAAMAPMVIAAIRKFEAILTQGALIVVEQRRQRARILPLDLSSHLEQGE